MGKFTNWKNVYVKCDCCNRVELVAEGQTDRLIANDWMKENGWKNRKVREGVWMALCPDCNAALLARERQKGVQNICGEEEAKHRRENLRTQGRKGCKSKRINMAFSDSNHEFIETVSRATGQTMTSFVNMVIQSYRREHPDILDHAWGFIKLANYHFKEDE